MDKDTRNAIERATQRARKLLEDDFASQLEGTFDVLRAGSVAPKAGSHLSPRQVFQRDKIVAAIEHKRAAGMSGADAVADYLRDAAFTALNRFVALKMLEARELVQECITKGEQSGGFREFCGLAPGVALLPESTGYRLYIESLFDELSTEVKVLFDRRDPASVLWPKRATFEALLDVLNAGDLASVWGEDETIGWVYQFFNSGDERRAMRDASQSPRNSRELAVRNQFFTPRYVVRFLTDNTLGRLWWEMRRGSTHLASRCGYLVRRPGEPTGLRVTKDPRDIRVIDPACGSGHFLLYSFDLLETMYLEAFEDRDSPPSDLTGRTLAADFRDIAELQRALPGLILAHNLHGVDIDGRCAQIAQLALWMRAQRAFQDFGILRQDRPRVRRVNVVVAEAMPGEVGMREEFLHSLPETLKKLVARVFSAMDLAGEAGSLLKIEQEIHSAIRDVYGDVGGLFAKSDRDRWMQAEEELLRSLHSYSEQAEGPGTIRRKLFAEDAARGFSFIDICRRQFDVALMNPPFGRAIRRFFDHQRKALPDCYVELFAQFLDRGIGLAPRGFVGAITSRSFLTISRLKGFRKRVLVHQLSHIADLGAGVMDSAFVESAAYVLTPTPSPLIWGADLRTSDNRAEALAECVRADNAAVSTIERRELLDLPEQKILYNVPAQVRRLLSREEVLEPTTATVRQGMATFDNFRFLRLRWEVAPARIGRDQWEPLAKGGAFSFYLSNLHLLLNWTRDGAELSAVNIAHNGQDAQVRQASDYWRRPGLTYSYRSQRGFSARILPAGCIVAAKGPAILSQSDVAPLYLLGWINSRLIRWLIELQANAHEYKAGIAKRLPWVAPSGDSLPALLRDTEACVDLCAKVLEHDETTARFCQLPGGSNPNVGWASYCTLVAASAAHLRRVMSAWDAYVDSLYGVDSSKLALDVAEEDEDAATSEEDEDEEAPGEADGITWEEYARRSLSIALGCALGRWRCDGVTSTPVDATRDPFSPLPAAPPLARDRHAAGEDDAAPDGIRVDDEGHPRDIVLGVSEGLESMFDGDALADLCGALPSRDARRWIRQEAFEEHLRRYSGSRRRAPVFWQLAVPSSSYSIWLHYLSLTADTFYKVQNDFVLPKLALEERKLESARRDLGPASKAAARRGLEAQESLVNELREFLEEVRRVTPLWSPNLDDGVIINFAPLWRIVPQNKSWQKELKSTWDALADGKYDWAHLAMHLWPERVVPKCAKDRSLAIAHALEDVFWVEGIDGKWTARKTPARSIDELVRERTSPAVKAALKSLLEAPVAQGGSGRGGRGRVRAAATADEGGSR